MLPLSSFRGSLRCIRLAAQPQEVRDVFRECFPLFFAEKTHEDFARAQKWGSEAKLDVVMVEGVPRRFEGNDSLSRGCYYTVVQRDGTDGGTLLQELYAYLRRDTIPRYFIFDLSIAHSDALIPTFLHGLNAFLFVPLSGHGNLQPLIAHAETAEVAIDGVVDLRIPETLRWVSKEVQSGLGGIYRRVHPYVPEHPQELLPSLMWPAVGGGDVNSPGVLNRVIGHVLRDQGANGLIFPSARRDAGVVVNCGVLESWGGWNLVDYRSSGPPAPQILKNVWLDHTSYPISFPYRHNVTIAPDDSSAAGSFRVEGPEAHMSEIIQAIYGRTSKRSDGDA